MAGQRGPSLSRSTTVRYALGSLGTGGFATLPGLVLVYYLTDTLGVAAIVAGGAVTGAKIWDVVIDPVIGGLSDRAYAIHGSRRGPMFAGIIGLPIFFLATFSVPAGLPTPAAALWVLIAFILAATCFSLFQVPYIALPAELTPSYSARTHLLTWRVVVLTAAILIFGGGGPEVRGLVDDPHLGYFVMALISALLLFIGTWVAATIVPRKTTAEAGPPTTETSSSTDIPERVPLLAHYRSGWRVLRESQPFRALLATFVLQGLTTGLMLAAAQFVARWILDDEGAVTLLFICLIAPALLVAPMWKSVAGRLGKERAFVIASLLFLAANVGTIPLIWVPGYWVIVPIIFAGAAYAGMQTLPMAMLPDVITVDARTHGDRAGAFGGVWTAGETAGMALGSTVLTVVLATTGYIASTAETEAVQPTSAIVGISCSFSIIPALLMAVSLATLTRYRLSKEDVDYE